MNLLDHYREMAWYNREMNRKIYGVCSELADEERKRDLGAFFGSIHGTLNHLVLTDRAWLVRFTGDSEKYRSRDASGRPIEYRSLAHVLYPEWSDLRREREKTDEDIIRHVAGLTPEAVSGTLSYQTSSGESCSHPVWWALSHMFNHETHHRGQVTTLMKQLGKDPGVTDLVALLRNRK
jgi:uncharacterized damage-inducible protein DinB